MKRSLMVVVAVLLAAPGAAVAQTTGPDLDPDAAIYIGLLSIGAANQFDIQPGPRLEADATLPRGTHVLMQVDVTNRGQSPMSGSWRVSVRPPDGWDADLTLRSCRDFEGPAFGPFSHNSTLTLGPGEKRQLCIALLPRAASESARFTVEVFAQGDVNAGNNQAVTEAIKVEPPRGALPIAAEVLSTPSPRRAQANASRGLAINLPLVGRVIGGGDTLYRTTVDVSNNTSSQTTVDFYFDGRDNIGAPITATGSISNAGIVRVGEGTLRGMTNQRFDDFIESLVQAGMVTPQARDRGIIGSLLLVFDSFSRRGEGSATARFYSALGNGTVGVSISGREITSDEPRALSGFVLDTRNRPVGQQQYANIFLNNTGLTRSGTAAGAVIVELRAVSAGSGTAIGRTATVDIAPGHTATISDVSFVLQIANEPALVFARVITGDAAIHGLVSTIDNGTRDGSVVYMNRAD